MSQHTPSQARTHRNDPDADPAEDTLSVVHDTEAGSRQDVTGAARDGVVEVTQEAKRQTRRLLDETRQQLRQQTAEQTQHVTRGLHTLGSHIEALVEGRPEEAGEIARYLQDAANQVHDMAGRVEQLGPDGVSREVQRFARRRPGAFLLGAAAAGFAVARLGRGVVESDKADGTPATPSLPDRPQTGGTTPYMATQTPSSTSGEAGMPPQTDAGPRDVMGPGTGEVRR